MDYSISIEGKRFRATVTQHSGSTAFTEPDAYPLTPMKYQLLYASDFPKGISCARCAKSFPTEEKYYEHQDNCLRVYKRKKK